MESVEMGVGEAKGAGEVPERPRSHRQLLQLLFGDLKEISKMTNQARSKPINFTNDIAPRVVPFFHQNVKNYGTSLILQPILPFDSRLSLISK
jgi:hypothetical protein